MENLTHTLVGLMMARAGLAKTTQRGAGMMMLAANMPDLDTVSWFGGTLTYIQYHRGDTHSLTFAPLIALIPMLLVRAGLNWRAYVASLLGVLSHLLLDWTNVYGIRLFLPFSDRWPHLDITDIVDPWIWVILLLALAAPWLSGLVSGEISSKSTGAGNANACVKRAWAWFAILALLAFEGTRFITHQRALDVMNARLYNGAVARRITALPGTFNPLRWRGVIEGDGFVRIAPLDLRTHFDPAGGRVYYPAATNGAITAAMHTRPFEVFGRFNQVPFLQVTKLSDATAGDATRVQLIDLRFGTPEYPGFATTAVVDASGRVLKSQFGLGGLPQPK